MGNWSASKANTRRASLEALEQHRRAKDADYPAIERPCGTPGAVYSLVVDGNILAIGVTVPFDINAALPSEAKERMKAALHDAVLPLVERFYRDVWAGTIAGKIIGDDPEPMPQWWEQLFEKWLRRCVQRGEAPMFDGRTFWSVQNIHNWLQDLRLRR